MIWFGEVKKDVHSYGEKGHSNSGAWVCFNPLFYEQI